MTSNAPDVDTYLKEVPVERLEALKQIRALCKEVLTDYEELMAYGGPCYARNGKIELGFASQKHFIGLYILNEEAMDKSRPLLKGISVGKGCIRYTKPDKIDFKIVRKLLEDTVSSDGKIC